MKLPQANLEGIHRDERWTPRGTGMSPGIDPLWLRDALGWVGGKIKDGASAAWSVGKKLARPAACLACNAIPNPIGQIACRAVACR